MIRNKKFVLTICVSAFTMLALVAITYAALSQTLTITMNKTTQKAMTWDIHFIAGTITGSAVTNNSGNVDCGTATATATTISGFSPVLSGVGDKCSYTFTIQNAGSIPGKIDTILFGEPSEATGTCTGSGSSRTCGDITYELHYDTVTGTAVAVGDVINAMSGSTPTAKTVLLTVAYSGTTAGEEDFTQSGFSYTLGYKQN